MDKSEIQKIAADAKAAAKEEEAQASVPATAGVNGTTCVALTNMRFVFMRRNTHCTSCLSIPFFGILIWELAVSCVSAWQ